jgi:hypothetical protein
MVGVEPQRPPMRIGEHIKEIEYQKAVLPNARRLLG